MVSGSDLFESKKPATRHPPGGPCTDRYLGEDKETSKL